jgi:hypothetical protein
MPSSEDAGEPRAEGFAELSVEGFMQYKLGKLAP